MNCGLCISPYIRQALVIVFGPWQLDRSDDPSETSSRALRGSWVLWRSSELLQDVQWHWRLQGPDSPIIDQHRSTLACMDSMIFHDIPWMASRFEGNGKLWTLVFDVVTWVQDMAAWQPGPLWDELTWDGPIISGQGTLPALPKTLSRSHGPRSGYHGLHINLIKAQYSTHRGRYWGFSEVFFFPRESPIAKSWPFLDPHLSEAICHKGVLISPGEVEALLTLELSFFTWPGDGTILWILYILPKPPESTWIYWLFGAFKRFWTMIPWPYDVERLRFFSANAMNLQGLFQPISIYFWRKLRCFSILSTPLPPKITNHPGWCILSLSKLPHSFNLSGPRAMHTPVARSLHKNLCDVGLGNPGNHWHIGFFRDFHVFLSLPLPPLEPRPPGFSLADNSLPDLRPISHLSKDPESWVVGHGFVWCGKDPPKIHHGWSSFSH